MDTGAIGSSRFAAWGAEHFQCFDNRNNLRARANGILHDILKEFRRASERSGVIRDVVSRKDQPAAGLSVTVNEILDRLKVVSAFL